MFLSVVVLSGLTTETHAMALHIRTDTPPLLTPHQETHPYDHCSNMTRATLSRERMCGHVVPARTHRKGSDK